MAAPTPQSRMKGVERLRLELDSRRRRMERRLRRAERKVCAAGSAATGAAGEVGQVQGVGHSGPGELGGLPRLGGQGEHRGGRALRRLRTNAAWGCRMNAWGCHLLHLGCAWGMPPATSPPALTHLAPTPAPRPPPQVEAAYYGSDTSESSGDELEREKAAEDYSRVALEKRRKLQGEPACWVPPCLDGGPTCLPGSCGPACRQRGACRRWSRSG
jgi:hypothetical protein